MTTRGFFSSGSGGGAPPLPTGQEMVDRIQAEIRAKTPRPLYRPPPDRPPPLTPTNDIVSSRLAEEIAFVRRVLDATGDSLCADAAVTARHPMALQQFDIVGQILGHIATILETDQREEAISRVGMSDLRARLMRKAL